MSSTQNPSSFERKVLALLQGFRADFPASSCEVIFGGKTMTLAQVHEALEQIAERLGAVNRAQAAHRRALAARQAAMGASRTFYEDGVLFVRHHFGRHSKRLTPFGVPVPKARRVLSSQEKAIANAKAAATRLLRGTKGKRQRAAMTLSAQPTLQVFGADGRLLPGQEAAGVVQPAPSPPLTRAEPNPSGAE